jgi:hypothetical protein
VNHGHFEPSRGDAKVDMEALCGRTEWVSQNDSAMIISLRLLDCSKNVHCSTSQSGWEGQTHDQSAPHAGHAKHRKSNSEQEPKSPFVFTSERGAPFTTAGFARMVERAGAEAKLGFKAHPHMLRHACGYALANKGHDTRALQAYLGHRNIQHTVRYTELSPTRFKDFWRT